MWLILSSPRYFIIFFHTLGLTIPQISPNMLCYLLCAFTVAAEAGYSLRECDIFELFSVWVIKKDWRYFTIYHIPYQGLINGFPGKDDDWVKKWFFVKASSASVSGLARMLHR